MEKSRFALLLGLAPAAYALVMVAASCSTFDTEPDGPDASSETSGSDRPFDPDGAPTDGAARAALEPVCPAPSGGSDNPSTWERRILFGPPPSGPKMFPFAIATDATHVTWIAQVATGPASDASVYDGAGDGLILRAPKDGSGAPVTLAAAQPLARALALDGIYAYWATYTANGAALMRTPRDCVGSCPQPEKRMMFPPGQRIDRLARATPGVLFAMSQGGTLFHIDVTASAPTQVYSTSANAALAVTTSSAFAAAFDWPKVGAAALDGGKGGDLFVITADDAGSAGVVPIATDCKSLWMIREPQSPLSVPWLLSYALGGAGTVRALKPLPIAPLDLAADATWLYFGAPNAGGVYMVDKSSGDATLLQPGNVWAVAVDGDGVYYGEHDRDTNTGNLYMLVKK